MSVHPRHNSDGSASYVVRWREGGRNRSRAFGNRRDAQTYDAEVIRRQRLGALSSLDAGRQTLGSFVAERWAPDRAADLAPATRRSYASLYSAHIGPTFDAMPLRDITPSKIAAWRAGREQAGAGRKALREAHSLLGGILGYAVELEEVQSNAARAVRPRRRERPRRAQALSVEQVEAIRRHLPEEWAVLVAVLAYTGVRPGEALHLRWSDVSADSLHVAGSIDLTSGRPKGTKTDTPRDVRLVAPLAQDLAAWQLRQGRPAPNERILPHPSGRPWTKTLWDNFRRREWRDALSAAQITRDDGRPIVPYDLRHTWASLLIAEGRNVFEVAEQLGHGAEQTLRTYGHVIGAYREGERIDVAAEIRRIRARGGVLVAEDVPAEFPRRSAAASILGA